MASERNGVDGDAVVSSVPDSPPQEKQVSSINSGKDMNDIPDSDHDDSDHDNTDDEVIDEEDEDEEYRPPKTPSMTVALLIYLVLPLLLLVGSSHLGFHPVPPVNNSESTGSRPQSDKHQPTKIELDASAAASGGRKQNTLKQNQGHDVGGPGSSRSATEKEMMRERRMKQNQEEIERRKRKIMQQGQGGSGGIGGETNSPQKKAMDDYINGIRLEHKRDPSDIFKSIALAEALRQRDLTYHDGGSGQMEAIATYKHTIQLINDKRKHLVGLGEPTNVPLSGPTNSLNDEQFLDYGAKSIDGLLCAVHSNLGKMFFMANMFERSVDAYDECLKIEPLYLDAIAYRAGSLIILGRYSETAKAYAKVLSLDKDRIFVDAYTGMSKVLVAKEEAAEPYGGWDMLVDIIKEEIPKQQAKLGALASSNLNFASSQGRGAVIDALKRMHLAMFSYHDSKTKDASQAWEHLQLAQRYKMSTVSPFDAQTEKQRTDSVKLVFHRNFWPGDVGVKSKTPIFIVGFVRSGSTLLERVLDAHPLIVGTGEDSVFNGRLDHIRNRIVEASMSGDPEDVRTTVVEMAKDVVKGMKARWKIIDANTSKDHAELPQDESNKSSRVEPKRFADKMLTNYMNIGFIHMLFPKALILHVAREPMDTCFSAFKHDFPPGGLDYTSEFTSLVHLYRNYRDIISHWDDVLPGRVTHVRYEDMVNDMPNVARSIISATGLQWDETVLDFHKKKHAVNTLSTTQVRKGVYKHGMKAWKKYEQPLQPLLRLLGDYANYDLKTTLPGYVPPSQK